MKLTEKPIETEKQPTELVCELTEEEFKWLSAETAAQVVVDILDGGDGAPDLMAGIAMTTMLAKYSAELAKRMFNANDKTNETENKEEN